MAQNHRSKHRRRTKPHEDFSREEKIGLWNLVLNGIRIIIEILRQH
jgi:hypothetical protein